MNRFATVTLGALGRVAGVITVSLALVAQPAVAQTGTIAGAVTDGSSATGISSAQVLLVGTGLGTLSNQGGRYIILNVPTGSQTVRVVRLGYATQEVQVTVTAGGTATVDFAMASEALRLDEIVVTGTAGAARRREIGNVVAQLDVADFIEPFQSVDQLLQARVPGMTVMQSSGMAGGGAKIRLRGNVSVAMSNQPLVYVDGVRIRSDPFHKNVPPTGYPGRSGNDVASPLNSINPADIERIEIIKGAAATTLYGTEAAAGVIQIFTKRGHQGAPQWTLGIEQGVANMRPFGVATDRRPTTEPATSVAGGTSPYMFIDPWLRNGYRQRYSLSVGGGGEDLQYFVSGSWQDDESVLPNDVQTVSSIRGNFTFTPASNLQLQWNTSFTSIEFFNTAAGNNAHGLTLNVFRRDANYFGNEEKENLDKLLNQVISTQIDHLITGGTATYTPTANFSTRLSVGYDLASQNNRNLRPFGFVRAPDGILADGRSEFETLTLDFVGTYSFDVTGDISSSLSFGGQSVTTEVQQTVAYGEDFPGPGDPTVTTAGTRLGFETRERVVNAGFFVQDVFDFSNKYFFTAGFRIDGNSAFGDDFGLQFYPKLSGSWVVSDEDFWGDRGQLKLRAAWGQSGRAPGAFDAVQTYDGVGWGGVPAFFPRVLGNSELGPERTAELEFGFDGSFFDDRIAIEATYYTQKTSDALFNVRQIPSNGFIDINGGNSQLENVGVIQNKGFEVALNAVLFEGDTWAWDLGGSLFTNKSEAELPAELAEINIGNNGWIVDGEPVPVVRGDKVMNPTDLAEPIIEDDQIYGPNAPTHGVGINTSVTLPMGLRFSARGEYQGGHYVTAGLANSAISRSVTWGGCYDEYTIEENGGRDALTAFQRARCNADLTESTFWAEKANFFKLREVSLQYQLPESLLAGANGATITVSGRNIWLWTNNEWTHFDPEMGNNNDNNAISRDGVQGEDALVTSIVEHVPAPAIWTVALRVVF